MNRKYLRKELFFCSAFIICVLAVVVSLITTTIPARRMQLASVESINEMEESAGTPLGVPALSPSIDFPPAHISTPAQVNGIYLTGWSAGNPKVIDRIISLHETTPINTVVIDIKDAMGNISYVPLDPSLATSHGVTHRIKNLSSLVKKLHEHGIYIIGRLTVFEDPSFADIHPEAGFLNKETGEVWKNYKGIAWLRPDSEQVWQYTSALALDAYTQGFDEINLDYVRFPSDGKLSLIDRPTTAALRESALEEFFIFMDQTLRRDAHIPLSADLFGLTLSAVDDLGIGQKLEIIAPHVDYVCPMIYPSHFAQGSYGIFEPAKHPYEIIDRSLADGITKLAAVGIGPEKLRPWLQDFNLLGVPYGKEEVAAQIAATKQNNISSWLFWDPANRYTPEGFVPSH